MNKENVRKAINIMKRAKNLCMLTWQRSPDKKSDEVYTEEELHACGNYEVTANYVIDKLEKLLQEQVIMNYYVRCKSCKFLYPKHECVCCPRCSERN